MTNIHAIGPFFVLLSVIVAGWSLFSRAIDFALMEICAGSFFVSKNSPASLIIRSKFSFPIKLSTPIHAWPNVASDGDVRKNPAF